MRVIWLGTCFMVASLTGGCVQQVAPVSVALPAVSAPIGFRCPPSGTVQTFNDNAVVTWLGAQPNQGDICIGRNQAGAPVQSVRGLFPLGGLWPDSIPAVRDAMMRVTTLAPGTPVSFMTTGQTANPNEVRPGTWTHTWRVSGQDRLRVGPTIRGAWTIDREARSGANVVAAGRYWIDQATGVRLKSVNTNPSTGQVTGFDTRSLALPSQ